MVCLTSLALISSRAAAQSIPSIWKTASDAEGHRAEIARAVDAKIAKLQSDDTEAQKYARQWLIEQAGTTQSPTASFLDVYADVINNALENIANPKKAPTTQPISIRIRLNAAIINAEVAKRANNARQSVATATFLRDPSEAVVLWGMKAAKYELASQLAQPAVMRRPDLLRAILDAVRAHPGSGAIAAEAYLALSLEKADPNLRLTSDDSIKELIPQIMDLANFRLSLFADAAPPDLFADGSAVVFLTRTKVWNLETSDQQQKVMDLLYNYVAAGGKLFNDPAVTDDRSELLDFIHQIGRAFIAIAVVKDNSLTSPLKKAADAIYGISPDTKPEDFDLRLKALKAAIDGMFPGRTAVQ